MYICIYVYIIYTIVYIEYIHSAFAFCGGTGNSLGKCVIVIGVLQSSIYLQINYVFGNCFI